METSAKRIALRRSDHIPILYAEHNGKNYIPAVMVNSSPDGMHFEAKTPLQPNTDLYIKLQGNGGGCYFYANSYKAFRAKVKWCRQLADGNGSAYSVGVRYMAKSHLSYGLILPDAADCCDCCETKGTGLVMQKAGYLITAPSIAKDFIVLQKQSFDSAFDAVELFQEQVVKAGTLLLDQMGMGERAQKFLHPWQKMFIKGRVDSKKFINDNISCMENCLELFSNKGAAE